METTVKSRYQRKRRYCDHCNDYVAYSTYRAHRLLVENQASLQAPDNPGSTQPNIPHTSLNESVSGTVSEKDISRGGEYSDEEDLAISGDISLEPNESDSDSSDDHVHNFVKTNLGLSQADKIIELMEEGSDEENESDSQTHAHISAPKERFCDGHGESHQQSTQQVHYVHLRLILQFLFMWQFVTRATDRALGMVLKFVKLLVKYLGTAFHCPNLVLLAEEIPLSLTKARNTLGISDEQMSRLIVCPSCNSVYMGDEFPLTLTEGDINVSANCPYVAFPKHPHQLKRQPCSAPLMKQVRLKNGKIKWKPIKEYFYSGVVERLKCLMRRPDFLRKCELWRNHFNPNIFPEILRDIYDGKVWRDFQEIDGSPFLSLPCNFAFMLNVDWIQPCKHVPMSVGIIYLVVLNLPREERFKLENVIVTGVIPGPDEPKENINSFLDPIVDELLQLWRGLCVNDSSIVGSPLFIRGALLCLSADLPAARKAGGFLGHSAHFGCSKCKKEFTCAAFGDPLNCSGYVREEWPPRNDSDHRKHAMEEKHAKTKTHRKEIQRMYGVRYSTLYRLPYYDSIRFVVIDPMHNLLLGTAKHMLKVWKEVGMIDDGKLIEIQKRIESITVPTSIGRLPVIFSSSFSSLNADQLRNWTSIYSMFALNEILPTDHLECWQSFVIASTLFCSRIITNDDAKVADEYIMKFCTKYEDLYGELKCTPNMHMHGHLLDCILDYGPVYGYWCFPFERFNGIMEQPSTNNHCIELTMMRKFLEGQQTYNINKLAELDSEFEDIFGQKGQARGTGMKSLHDISTAEIVTSIELASPRLILQSVFPHNCYENITFIPPLKEQVLSAADKKAMYQMFHEVYSDSLHHVSDFVVTSSQVSIAGELYGSQLARTARNAYVISRWSTGKDIRMCSMTTPRPGKTEQTDHYLCKINWHKDHLNWNHFGYPVQVWSTEFHNLHQASYMPVHRIMSHCAYGRVSVDFGEGSENVMIIIPVGHKQVTSTNLQYYDNI